MGEIIIREMDIKDYDQVYELWSSIRGIGLSGADARENIDTYLKRNQGFSFVCERQVKIVGSILCGHDGRRGFIHHLAVDEKYRQKGLGEKLVLKSLARLKQEKIQKCHLFVLENNQLGKDFWSKKGWTLREDIATYSKDL